MRRAHSRVELTEYQEQVLTGLMLGDGFISSNENGGNNKLAVKRVKNSHLVVQRAEKDANYLAYEAELFRNFLSQTCMKQTDLLVHWTPAVDKRTGLAYPACKFETIYSPVFTDWRSKWYKLIDETKDEFVKIVPTDLKLSPITIAHWVADDGNVNQTKLPYRFRIELSTHGFTEKEVRFLADLLHQRYHEKFVVSDVGSSQFIILAYDSACRAVFADIDPYFKMQRKRLWDDPTARFYHDPPPKQVSQKDLFNWRKDVLQELIDNNDSLPIKEIKKKLKYLGKGGILYRLRTILREFSNQISIDRSDPNNYIAYFNHSTNNGDK